jgi:hypothetical protein
MSSTGQKVRMLNNGLFNVQFKINIGSTSTAYTDYFMQYQSKTIDLGDDTYMPGKVFSVSGHSEAGVTRHYDGLTFQPDGATIELVASGTVDDWKISLA